MIELKDFSAWMRENTTLSKSSIYKYTRAINTISNEMKARGVINDSLLAMSSIQLDLYVPFILKNQGFVTKNTTGNNMYSSAIKYYRLFRNIDVQDAIERADVTSVIEDYNTLQETERIALVKSRVGQGYFRKELIKKYNSSCVITGISEKKLLVASHIKPWAVCTNKERLSVENGLLLSPTFDKLFDCGLISFKNTGKILISSQLSDDVIMRLNISSSDSFDLKASAELKHNLEYHRDVVFINRGKRKTI